MKNISPEDYGRFLNDVQYDLLIPPDGINYRGMTPGVAKRSFQWFVSKIPERMAYFRSRCAHDLKIPINRLDYSEESLLLVWKWFLRTARTEKTPEDLLAPMIEGAKIFGDSFINWRQRTPVTRFIERDIAMYVGECFLAQSSKLYWSYTKKPKSNVMLHQPAIEGLGEFYNGKFYPQLFAPIHMVGVQAAKILSNEQNEQDLYRVFQTWKKYIPTENEL